jgi:hypothetical protein
MHASRAQLGLKVRVEEAKGVDACKGEEGNTKGEEGAKEVAEGAAGVGERKGEGTSMGLQLSIERKMHCLRSFSLLFGVGTGSEALI